MDSADVPATFEMHGPGGWCAALLAATAVYVGFILVIELRMSHSGVPAVPATIIER